MKLIALLIAASLLAGCSNLPLARGVFVASTLTDIGTTEIALTGTTGHEANPLLAIGNRRAQRWTVPLLSAVLAAIVLWCAGRISDEDGDAKAAHYLWAASFIHGVATAWNVGQLSR